MLWQKLLGTDGGGIQYVGGRTAGIPGTASNVTVSLTSLTGGLASAPAANDLVIVYFSVGSNTNVSLTVAGYTELIELYSADVEDSNLAVAYKYMTATPDTSFVLTGGTGDSNNSGAVAIQVFRKAVISSEQASATGINGGRPNPPSVTPVTAGSVVVVGGGAGYSVSGAPIFTSSDLTNFITEGEGGFYDTTVGMGYYRWSSGAFDPAQFGGGTVSTTAAWTAYTFTIKPA
jgi:hypothetical protein